jgi:hypothetical protein
MAALIYAILSTIRGYNVATFSARSLAETFGMAGRCFNAQTFSIRAPGQHVYFQPVVPAGEEAKWGILTSVPGTTVP